MSDEFAEQVKKDQPVPTPDSNEGKSVTVMITLHPNGQIDFQMPAKNKVLAYGLLECARAQLDKMYLTAEVKQAQSARGGLGVLLKRMNGG